MGLHYGVTDLSPSNWIYKPDFIDGRFRPMSQPESFFTHNIFYLIEHRDL